MKTIQFGLRDQANEYRDKLSKWLADSDDRRSKTLKLKESTPDNIVERLESEAFASQESDTVSAGMAELTDSERDTLARTSGFEWRKHGFEAMRAKAALQKKGATEWTDFYETGEGARGAVENLRESKKRSAGTGASIGVGGQRTDEEELVDRRQRRQVERGQSQDVDRAKRPAFGGDVDAITFLREEEIFTEDLFDIRLRTADAPAGEDYRALQEAHEARSERAQRVDERRSAEVTRDPLEWAAAKNRVDFPGIDTVQPERIHQSRSERAREMDEKEFAPIADTREQWAKNPDRYDWKGVDTPAEYGPTMDTPIPSAERNTRAPESLTTNLAKQDVSLSPEEAFEGVGAESMSISATASPFGLAGGREADMAFMQAEEDRAKAKRSEFSPEEMFQS